VELTVITGMSGAGKSQAMGVFEDAGWEPVYRSAKHVILDVSYETF